MSPESKKKRRTQERRETTLDEVSDPEDLEGMA